MPLISFSGLASGLDSQAIVNSLVDVQRIPILRLEQDTRDQQARLGIIDNLSSALANLRTASTDLDTTGEFLAYSGSVSDEDVATVTASGDSVPGQYQLDVTTLASAQRTYSSAIADDTAALSASDQTLTLSINGVDTDLTITAGMSLRDVAAEINASGTDASAGIMFDGTNYRLQVVGGSTGATNAITFTDTGLGLGLEVPANTIQAATDAVFTLDGFTITSEDNLIDNVLAGTTLELTATTTSPVSVSIGPDGEAVEGKIQAFVDAYNEVMTIVNAQVGEGKGTDTLNGDATVRSVEIALARTITSPIPGLMTPAGDTMQLSDLGISAQSDGTLTLDSTKLDEALAAGFADTAAYFVGNPAAAVDGMGQILDAMIDTYTDSIDGLLTVRKEGIESLIEDNDDQIEGLERYIESYEAQLLNQFAALETAMSSLQSQQAYLAQFLQPT